MNILKFFHIEGLCLDTPSNSLNRRELFTMGKMYGQLENRSFSTQYHKIILSQGWKELMLRKLETFHWKSLFFLEGDTSFVSALQTYETMFHNMHLCIICTYFYIYLFCIYILWQYSLSPDRYFDKSLLNTQLLCAGCSLVLK